MLRYIASKKANKKIHYQTLTVTLKAFSQVAVVSCECPVFGKRFFFYILVLELLALLRIQEELRDRVLFGKLGNFSTERPLHVQQFLKFLRLRDCPQNQGLPDIACRHPPLISWLKPFCCVIGGYKLCFRKRFKIQ